MQCECTASLFSFLVFRLLLFSSIVGGLCSGSQSNFRLYVSFRSFSVEANSTHVHTGICEELHEKQLADAESDVARPLLPARLVQFDDLSPIAEHSPTVTAAPPSDPEHHTSEVVLAQRRAKFALSRPNAAAAGASAAVRSRFSRSDEEDASVGLSGRHPQAGLDRARRWLRYLYGDFSSDLAKSCMDCYPLLLARAP